MTPDQFDARIRGEIVANAVLVGQRALGRSERQVRVIFFRHDRSPSTAGLPLVAERRSNLAEFSS